MERDLDMPLFKRNSHEVQITTWGARFLEINLDYLKKVSALKEAFLAEKSTLHIATLDQPDFSLLSRMEPFIILETNITVHMQITYETPASLFHTLLGKKADAVITLKRFMPYDKGFSSISLQKVSVAFLLFPEYPGYYPGVSWKKFINEPLLIGVNHSNFFDTQQSINKDIEQFHLNPNSITILPETKNAIGAAVEKKGIILGTTLNHHMLRPASGLSSY